MESKGRVGRENNDRNSDMTSGEGKEEKKGIEQQDKVRRQGGNSIERIESR